VLQADFSNEKWPLAGIKYEHYAMNNIAIGVDQWQLHLRPDLGGSIEALSFHGLPVLRSSAAGSLTNVRLSGCYPLVPFSNRVAQAQLVWNGTNHPLVKNFPGEEHSIHGVGWKRAWQVLDVQEDSCMLSLEHRADSAWPFAFDASQTFRVHGNTLTMLLSITNQSAHAAPVGLGWHPYFVKRAQSHLQFAAQGMWGMGDDKLPTNLQMSSGLNQACADLVVDNCFEQWSGQAMLSDEAMQVKIESDVKRLVVFTNSEKDFIAIEPVSHVNNAMNLGNAKESERQGVVVLGAAQSHQISMSLTVDLK
jgi:aldose 1-epimerase